MTNRLRGYPIMDVIADVFVSYYVVSEDFRKTITPLLVSYFIDERNHYRRPSFLRGRRPDDCVQSERRSIEYKVERLLLDQYKKRHKRLPPGNPRTGSYREYLENVAIEERGHIRILDMPCASPAPILLEGEQLVSPSGMMETPRLQAKRK